PPCSLSSLSPPPPPLLPSSPTRRSSDLLALALACLVGGIAAAAGLREPVPHGEPLDAEAIVRPLRDRRIWLLSLASALLVGAQLDRKSTRLNSSHQIISYAVFCLITKTN